jgi:hypothetical protein
MPDEPLPPRMQDAQDADLRAQVARVGGHLTQGGGTRLKEPGVQPCGVAIRQRQQCVRQREDDMHRARREAHAPARRASGHGPGLDTSDSADCDTSYRRWPDVRRRRTDRPARRARRSDTASAHGERSAAACSTTDAARGRCHPARGKCRHLHGRPAHDCGGFRSRRDRGTTGGGVTCNCSSGMGAAWRCRRDRWRYTVVCERSAWPSNS